MLKYQLILYANKEEKLSVNFKNWDIVFRELPEKV